MRALRVCGSLALVVVAGVVWFSTSPGHLLAGGHPSPSVSPLPPFTGNRSQPRGRGHHPAGRARSADKLVKRSSSPGAPNRATPPPHHRPRPPAPIIPDQADLQAALLTAGQLPGGGYTVQSAAASVGLGSLKYCPALSAGESGVSAQASVAFTAGQVGPDVSEGLFQDTVTGAEQMLGAFTTVADTCGSFTTEVDGLHLAISVEPVPLPPAGDQTAAVQVNVTVTVSADEDATISGDVVAIRHGGTVIVITNVQYPQLDQGLTQEIATAAYAKVAARW